MARQGSQKFIGRNRAPRVQIEYDVETYGSEKKVQLPFVMGVMSDLVGKSVDLLPDLENRTMFDIDVDNFDDRMKALKPRVVIQVPNRLTGEGNLPVDLTFKRMEDFSPAAIAQNVDSLARLLEARSQLSNLLTYMDGKTSAEMLVSSLLADPELLRVLAAEGCDKAVAAEDHPDAAAASPVIAAGDPASADEPRETAAGKAALQKED